MCAWQWAAASDAGRTQVRMKWLQVPHAAVCVRDLPPRAGVEKGGGGARVADQHAQKAATGEAWPSALLNILY